jgi:hypothetical protein
MPRPRKNPNDPKWVTTLKPTKDYPPGTMVPESETIKVKESIKTQELTDVKLVLYAVSLAGVIAQGKPVSHEQAARSAMEYAEAAMRIWK